MYLRETLNSNKNNQLFYLSLINYHQLMWLDRRGIKILFIYILLRNKGLQLLGLMCSNITFYLLFVSLQKLCRIARCWISKNGGIYMIKYQNSVFNVYFDQDYKNGGKGDSEEFKILLSKNMTQQAWQMWQKWHDRYDVMWSSGWHDINILDDFHNMKWKLIWFRK